MHWAREDWLIAMSNITLSFIVILELLCNLQLEYFLCTCWFLWIILLPIKKKLIAMSNIIKGRPLASARMWPQINFMGIKDWEWGEPADQNKFFQDRALMWRIHKPTCVILHSCCKKNKNLVCLGFGLHSPSKHILLYILHKK